MHGQDAQNAFCDDLCGLVIFVRPLLIRTLKLGWWAWVTLILLFRFWWLEVILRVTGDFESETSEIYHFCSVDLVVAPPCLFFINQEEKPDEGYFWLCLQFLSMWYFWLWPSSWTALLNVVILWQMYHCCCAATTQRFWSVRPLWWEFKTTVARRTPSSRWRSTTTGTSPAGHPLLIGQAILPCHSHTSHPPVTTLAPCQIVMLLQWTHPVHHCTVVLTTEEPHLTSTAVLTATALLQNSTVPSQTMTVPHCTMAIQVLLLTVTTALHLIMIAVYTKHLFHTSAWVSCATFCFFIDVNEISAFMTT